VVFVPSTGSRSEVDAILRGYAEGVGQSLSPGAYSIVEVADHQDLKVCLRAMTELETEVERWLEKTVGHYEVIVDLTGGTKPMTAALALRARRWRCTFSYIGGDQRTKGGLGTVITGSERPMYTANPWDALGWQTIEDYVVLFDQGAYAAAANAAKSARDRVTDSAHAAALAILEHLAAGFDLWDRFQHADAKARLEKVTGAANDLNAALGASRANPVLRQVEMLIGRLDQLPADSKPGGHHVIDLLANARRRYNEGRFDDAVGRLYRAIEAIAQVRLAENYAIVNTGRIPEANVPESLREKWKCKAQSSKKKVEYKLGLDDDYALLAKLGDSLGAKFRELFPQAQGEGTLLTARNRSILAHGWAPVTRETCDKLWEAALKLAAIDESKLMKFPTIGR
jgi:CRISPR-associated protein (TIGR02710 family)